MYHTAVYFLPPHYNSLIHLFHLHIQSLMFRLSINLSHRNQTSYLSHLIEKHIQMAQLIKSVNHIVKVGLYCSTHCYVSELVEGPQCRSFVQ